MDAAKNIRNSVEFQGLGVDFSLSAGGMENVHEIHQCSPVHLGLPADATLESA